MWGTAEQEEKLKIILPPLLFHARRRQMYIHYPLIIYSLGSRGRGGRRVLAAWQKKTLHLTHRLSPVTEPAVGPGPLVIAVIVLRPGEPF